MYSLTKMFYGGSSYPQYNQHKHSGFVAISLQRDCSDELGDVVTPSWSFGNDCGGFSLLKELLTTLGSDTKIGFESTGHYGQNLKLFLKSNGFTFVEFNPFLISRFVYSKSLRKTKTDAIDAQIIAQYLMTVEYKPYPASFYHMDKLKSLTRFRDSLVWQRSRQLVELTNVLDKVFPEFKPFFKSRFSATLLYILSNYGTPEKISNMNSRSYDALRRLSRGKFTMNSFVQLKTLARNTVGHCNDYLIHEMEILLDIYNQMDARIQELEEQIVTRMEGIDPPILSIPVPRYEKSCS
ncbi:MAG: IS110 family transposase [Christensenellaceae bacterium]